MVLLWWVIFGPAAAADTAPRTLFVASWNAEWLADATSLDDADFWGRCAALGWPNEKLRPDLPFCDVYPRARIHDGAAYRDRKLTPVRQVFAELAARRVDIVSVQEVQSEQALASVLPAGYRVLCITTRPDAQNLAFVVRDTLAADLACREVHSLSLAGLPDLPRPVRRGLELRLIVSGRHVTILGVHLKAGCPTGPLDRVADGSCRMLAHQSVPLEAWIESRARDGDLFAVIGDWNRDLEAEVRGGYRARSDGSDPASPAQPGQIRKLFPELNDGSPPESALRLAATDRGVAVHGACHPNLDQLVASRTLLDALDPKRLLAGLLPARLLPVPAGASDHCVLETVMVFR